VESPVPGLKLTRRATVGQDLSFQFGRVSPVDAGLFLETTPAGALHIKANTWIGGRPGINLRLEDGESTTVVVEVSGGKTLRGRAIDAATSEPLAGIIVFSDSRSFTPDSNRTVTDEAGEFVLEHVAEIST
jgi:hypothetical protein